jgi:hypothetical protein
MDSLSAEKVVYFVISSEARNFSSIEHREKKERFLASLEMTKGAGNYFGNLLSLRIAPGRGWTCFAPRAVVNSVARY